QGRWRYRQGASQRPQDPAHDVQAAPAEAEDSQRRQHPPIRLMILVGRLLRLTWVASGIRLRSADSLSGDRIPGHLLTARGVDVPVDDADNILALLDDLAAVQPDHPVAGVLDLLEVVRNEEHGAGLLPQIVDPGVALDPELGVAGREGL